MAVKVKPSNDAYTVLLSISLVAMITSCVLLYYDIKRYPSVVPPSTVQNPGGGGAGGK